MKKFTYSEGYNACKIVLRSGNPEIASELRLCCLRGYLTFSKQPLPELVSEDFCRGWFDALCED
jgi:hypothetical protein